MIPPAIQKLIALKKLDQLSADDQQRLDEWLASDSANAQLANSNPRCPRLESRLPGHPTNPNGGSAGKAVEPH